MEEAQLTGSEYGLPVAAGLDAIAAKRAEADCWRRLQIWMLKRRRQIDTHLAGVTAKSARAETLTAPSVDSINTFNAPHRVTPKPAVVRVQSGGISSTVELRLVTVITIEHNGAVKQP